jgi:hypothetical protein
VAFRDAAQSRKRAAPIRNGIRRGGFPTVGFADLIRALQVLQSQRVVRKKKTRGACSEAPRAASCS